MEEIVPGVFIGDYASSSDLTSLENSNVKWIISAMRQTYTPPSFTTLLQVPIDDSDSTNIILHFPTTCEFIKNALNLNQSVLIHCQAGISRSTTIIAAYLMKELEINAEEAVGLIKMKRERVDPTMTFLNQLEMWETCKYEWNPVKWVEQRRFLMSFAQAQIMDGASPSLVLAYYPSPDPSPGTNISTDPFKMTASTSEIEAILSESSSTPTGIPPARKRLTPKSAAKELEPERSTSTSTAINGSIRSVESIGTKAQVVVSLKRIRCRMCRRELASRENVIVHEPGIGQQAFAPRRRDMGAYRNELERRRLDEIDKEKLKDQEEAELETKVEVLDTSRKEAPVESPITTIISPNPVASVPTSSVTIPGLRIAKPINVIPGLRMAMPRPRPMASVPPPQSTTPTSSPPSLPPAPIISQTISEPPLLSSHLCSSYFVEPLSWMSNLLETGELSGKLFCPGARCNSKLGSWDWAGSQCSCGAWIVPSFAIGVSKAELV